MTFLSQYGLWMAVFALSAGIVIGSTRAFSRMGTILSSSILGIAGMSILIYGWLVPEDPFAGIAYGALAFCIVLGISVSWAFIDFQKDKDRE